jgi:methyl-accepting chemotaxis protein
MLQIVEHSERLMDGISDITEASTQLFDIIEEVSDYISSQRDSRNKA